MTRKTFRRPVLVRLFAMLGLTLLFVGLPMPMFSLEPVAEASVIGVPALVPSDGSELHEVGDLHDDGGRSAEAHAVHADGGPRLRGRAERVQAFSMIGVALDEVPTEPVLIRVRETDGRWGEWSELSVNPDEGPDLDSDEGRAAGSVDGYMSEPIWVADADGYELSVAESDSAGVNVVVVRESMRRVVVDATPAASGDYPVFDGLKSRSAWGARARKYPDTAPASNVRFAVVHHAVSTNNYGPADVPAQLRSIQAYHMDGRGWDDIGYNFVVDKFGGVWEGRAGSINDAVIGAHAAGFNSGSVGVMVLGTYTSTPASAAAKESVAKVIGWKFSQFGTPATGTTTEIAGTGSTRFTPGATVTIPRVVGHRDVGSTTCPGTIHGNLGSIRTRTIDAVAWFNVINRPIGTLDSVKGTSGGVSFRGWVTKDPTRATTTVRISAGWTVKDVVATEVRTDITSAQSGGRSVVGFSGTLNGVSPGSVKVCLTPTLANGHVADGPLKCIFATVDDPTGATPVGQTMTIRPGAGRIDLSGWALDPALNAPTRYRVYVDGVLRESGVADQSVSRLPEPYRTQVGTAHGFNASVVGIESGWRELCIAAERKQTGSFTNIACSYPLVQPHSPIGALEIARSTTKGKVEVSGWALDFEKKAGIYTRIRIGTRSYMIGANRDHAGVRSRYPEYGSMHGFSSTLAADGGQQRVCAYGVNVGGGADSLLGCKTVDVVK